ncbi:restriction endonuclease subunit S [Actibacterium sp. XHP0104]|uniref:restriction endonuclease subunit S n=1 Tax=Actibacterium sp. XHP0104 TaxID=2984335 RepID=UPI0021E95099|nr:restriction endonuclease subunit S [Actibacterium sp. XHP0104]MCV2882513.1 restriction endonuclease subunit S [Actibacterium sp. XHP0104]
MPRTVVSDLVEPITDKQVADQAKPEAYIGLEHIPERAIRIERTGDTEAIRGMCVRFSEGDILFGKLRPNLRKSVLAPVNGLGSTEIIVLRPKLGVDPSFAGHVLRSEAVFFEAERMTEGTRMPRTSWKTLSAIEVFAPSDLRAQKLIADILDAIDDAILETDAVIEKLKAVGKGMAADLFCLGLDGNGELRQPYALRHTALGMLPLDWTVDRLDTIFGVFGGKRLPLGHTYAMEATGFRYLRVTDFFGEESRPHELPSLETRTFKALERYEITDGALAVSIAGSIGRFHPFRNDTDLRVILTENAARLEPKKSINPDFYARFLNSLPVQKQVELEIGTGGGVPKLALHRIQALKIVDVPRDEQDEISRRLNALELEIQAYRRERAKLSSLREGLRDDLLTGRKPVVAIREAAE